MTEEDVKNKIEQHNLIESLTEQALPAIHAILLPYTGKTIRSNEDGGFIPELETQFKNLWKKLCKEHLHLTMGVSFKRSTLKTELWFTISRGLFEYDKLFLVAVQKDWSVFIMDFPEVACIGYKPNYLDFDEIWTKVQEYEREKAQFEQIFKEYEEKMKVLGKGIDGRNGFVAPYDEIYENGIW